jgi:hypothetical protein
LNNSSLIDVFNRLSSIEFFNDTSDYFLVKNASKLVEYFPSLVRVVFNIYLFDNCVPIVDILLPALRKLIYLKINFHRYTLLDDPFTSDYITDKRRQTFTLNSNNEDQISVINDGQSLIISIE